MNGISFGAICSLLLIILCGAGMWGCPRYNVWQQGLEGAFLLLCPPRVIAEACLEVLEGK